MLEISPHQLRNLHMQRGYDLIKRFCEVNGLEVPEIRIADRATWAFSVCAYYRPTYIAICIEKCALVGKAGMQWSFPGYIADRTPYGVLAHEIGHHVDVMRGRTARMREGTYFSEYSTAIRKESGEKKLTSYCPNDAEWFAEMMRLFITNPTMLATLRPRTFNILWNVGFRHVEPRPWNEVLAEAPSRTWDMAHKHMGRAQCGADA